MILEYYGLTPRISEDVWIADSATIIGDVVLEKDSSIWFNAVIRADDDEIYIGQATNIQDNCVLHCDPGFPIKIGRGTTVGHNATLHGCTIGDNVVIGMGSTVMNGAVIGNNSVVGAGALVGQGMVIPENSLVVGIPARLVKTIDPRTIAINEKDNRYYVTKSKRFKNESKVIG